MPIYVWTAQDRSGVKIVREVRADNIESSKKILVDEGCINLALHEDDIIAAAHGGFPDKVQFLGEEITVTGADRLKHMDKPRMSYLQSIRETIADDKGLFLVGISAGAVGLWFGYHFVIWIFVALSLAWISFRVWMSIPMIWFENLNKARDWHRWEEVLSLVRDADSIRKRHFMMVPQVEVTRANAQALVGLGRVEEGIALYQQCEGQPGCPSWMYKAMVGGLYSLARQYHKSVAYSLAAIAENPTPSLFIDLANQYIRLKDIVNARAALAKAQEGTLVEIAKPFVLRSKGVIAYLEGDHVAAKENLSAALVLHEAAHNQPFRDGNISITRTFLAAVCAKQGDARTAREHFAAESVSKGF